MSLDREHHILVTTLVLSLYSPYQIRQTQIEVILVNLTITLLW
jgi:hypothetical protein